MQINLYKLLLCQVDASKILNNLCFCPTFQITWPKVMCTGIVYSHRHTANSSSSNNRQLPNNRPCFALVVFWTEESIYQSGRRWWFRVGGRGWRWSRRYVVPINNAASYYYSLLQMQRPTFEGCHISIIKLVSKFAEIEGKGNNSCPFELGKDHEIWWKKCRKGNWHELNVTFSYVENNIWYNSRLLCTLSYISKYQNFMSFFIKFTWESEVNAVLPASVFKKQVFFVLFFHGSVFLLWKSVFSAFLAHLALP